MDKECIKCNSIKNIKEFYKGKSYSDGYRSKCKNCILQECKEYRMENKDKIKKYERSPNRALKRRERFKEECLKFPEKIIARRILRKAINKKQILKPSNCSICGSNMNIEGHHNDYSEPLNVIWLCVSCHKEIHNKH